MSETELEKHYRETLEYVGEYAAKRDFIVYLEHIMEVVINALEEGQKIARKSS